MAQYIASMTIDYFKTTSSLIDLNSRDLVLCSRSSAHHGKTHRALIACNISFMFATSSGSTPHRAEQIN
jgi:hypothetical protein